MGQFFCIPKSSSLLSGKFNIENLRDAFDQLPKTPKIVHKYELGENIILKIRVDINCRLKSVNLIRSRKNMRWLLNINYFYNPNKINENNLKKIYRMVVPKYVDDFEIKIIDMAKHQLQKGLYRDYLTRRRINTSFINARIKNTV